MILIALGVAALCCVLALYILTVGFDIRWSDRTVKIAMLIFVILYFLASVILLYYGIK
ncbi:MAG: hypothetical protein HY602_02995 [Parcubacteria group bacterium]|nr:hypothetical protein [Parcubacteria group bacterium]